MIAIKAYYDGGAFVPLEKLAFKDRQQALIVLEEENLDAKPRASSCKGIAAAYANPALIPQEEFAAGEAFGGGVE